MRPALAIACALCLAACDDPQARAPFTRSRIPQGLPIAAYPPDGWAWGLIRSGQAPPARYGVGAPPVVPRGQVLILPAYGEPAEAWFEAAGGLIARGYTVWVLESVGQGGSGRYTLPRDVGDAPDFAPDIEALKAMRQVMGGKPALIIAQGTAAPLLLTALREGLPARGAVLSAPRLSPVIEGPYADKVAAAAPYVEQAQLGWLRAFGEPAWRRQEPPPSGRPGVIGAWQDANPELRVAGRSWGWLAAFQDQADALKAGSLAVVRAPVLILGPGAKPSADAASLCRRLARCAITPIPAGLGSLHLESDAALREWIEAVSAFMVSAHPE